MMIEFLAAFVPAFCISFTIAYFAVMGVRSVVRLVREAGLSKKTEAGLRTLDLAIATAVVCLTLYLRTRDARVAEAESRAEKAEAEAAKLKRDFHLIDDEEEEPRDRFPDANEVYSR